MIRPKEITDDHLKYLDALRESGVTNMWGASEYVADNFGLSNKKSTIILLYWMKTFGKDDR